MFPIPFNFPFIKKNGERTTIGDAIGEGGGGSPYELPTASADTKGGVKIGSGLTMTGEVLSNTNPTPYSLPTASDSVLGGIKVGSGLSITDGVLSAAGGSGGSGGHLFIVNTSNTLIGEIAVFTSNSEMTAEYASLLSALTNGYGIVTVSENGLNNMARKIVASGSDLVARTVNFTFANDSVWLSYRNDNFNSTNLTVSGVNKIY